jgi:uncharacterized protein (TIGR00730 family)
MPIRSVTVYCSSSTTLAEHFYIAAAALGRAIAENNWTLVYGGNSIGLMKSIADAVRESNGKVIGITPQIFVDLCHHDQNCELIVTQTMRQRKEILEQRGDAFIALPGGLGTFEELFEIIVGRSLGFHNKPIVLLNIADYWNPLLATIDHAIAQNFIKPKARQLYFVAENVSQAMAHLKNHIPVPDFRDKLPSAQE